MGRKGKNQEGLIEFFSWLQLSGCEWIHHQRQSPVCLNLFSPVVALLSRTYPLKLNSSFLWRWLLEREINLYNAMMEVVVVHFKSLWRLLGPGSDGNWTRIWWHRQEVEMEFASLIHFFTSDFIVELLSLIVLKKKKFRRAQSLICMCVQHLMQRDPYPCLGTLCDPK